MRITRVLFAVAAAVGIAVGSATPASAIPVDEPMYGIYTYHQDGAPDESWTIFATCVPAGCTLHMATTVSRSLGPVSDYPGYSGDARPVGGLWTWIVPKQRGVQCPDGSWTTANYSYAWDQPSVPNYSAPPSPLAGTLTVLTPDSCGLTPGMTKYPFTLTYKEPLPIPIVLDPLNQIENLW